MAPEGMLIGGFVHLRDYPREKEALHMLQKLASLVKPIMRKHSYTVGTLAEFWPEEKNLLGLNINHGEKICVRLRQPYDKTQFLDYKSVVGTMLHELTHNVHGPHDENFYSLLAKLEDEYSKLQVSGYTGEGFLSEGRVLGSSSRLSQHPSYEARRRALAAAEKRRNRPQGTGSGQRLGSSTQNGTRGSGFGGLNLKQRAAAAAVNRAQDNIRCGQESLGKLQKEIESEKVNIGSSGTIWTSAEVEDADRQAILEAATELLRDGTGFIPGLEEGAPTDLPASGISTGSAFTVRPAQSARGAISSSIHKRTWPCPACTFVNPYSFLSCEMCSQERPHVDLIPSVSQLPEAEISGVDSGMGRSQSWSVGKQRENTKSVPGDSKQARGDSYNRYKEFEGTAIKMKEKMWYCQHCTALNEAQWWTCEACGTMKQSS